MSAKYEINVVQLPLKRNLWAIVLLKAKVLQDAIPRFQRQSRKLCRCVFDTCKWHRPDGFITRQKNVMLCYGSIYENATSGATWLHA